MDPHDPQDSATPAAAPAPGNPHAAPAAPAEFDRGAVDADLTPLLKHLLDGGTLTLQLTGPNGLGFLLFRDGLQSIRYNSFSAEGGNRITLNVSDPGTYYVVVLGDTPEASGEYRLTSSR